MAAWTYTLTFVPISNESKEKCFKGKNSHENKTMGKKQMVGKLLEVITNWKTQEN